MALSVQGLQSFAGEDTLRVRPQFTDVDSVAAAFPDSSVSTFPSIRPRPLSRVQETVSLGLITAVDWFDTFFGEHTGIHEANNSYVRVEQLGKWEEGDGWHYLPGFGMKLHLPRIKNRVSLLVLRQEE